MVRDHEGCVRAAGDDPARRAARVAGSDARRGHWDPVALRWTATAVAVAAVAVAAVRAAPAMGPFGAVLAGGGALLAGALITLGGRRAPGVAIALCGSGVALVGCALAPLSAPGRVAGAVTVVATAVGLLGVATGRRRAGLSGAGALAGHLLLWWVALTAGLTTVRTAAVVAVVGAGLLGLLPQLAVAVAGLTALDDRPFPDGARLTAQAAVDVAHRGVAGAVVATAASVGPAGWVLAGGTGWSIALAGVTAAVLLLRLRAFPVTVEVVALLAAALVVVLGLTSTVTRLDPAPRWFGVGAALGVAALALVPLVYRPRPHVRARARRLADRVESIAVVATLPLAAGVFGVYDRLLPTS